MTETPPCPICHRPLSGSQPRDAHLGPFCSARCKLADLGNWLDGRYVVAEPISEPGPINGHHDNGSAHE